MQQAMPKQQVMPTPSLSASVLDKAGLPPSITEIPLYSSL
ncbi:hypothetical protein PU02_1047 [Bartonella ancashensis]|uniref:Uncharacterized protein n=1 Tax=Bartonella ancashensis TaxID=1318743 RepID=A0A0M3T325_9HYPH|nr:hypothetical protein PU02_1047 [Bartonella ancashensis]